MNNLTDNEIIKALECCPSKEYIVTYYDDEEIIVSDILNLINRQKAEIDNLTEQFRFLDCECERLEKADEKQRAEIERLTVENEALFKQIRYLDVECERLENSKFDRDVTIGELYIKLEAAKAEITKELAERLKTELSFGKYIQADKIDNLVKEMVGEG